MKFTIHREDFAKALSWVRVVCSSRTTLPILSTVLLTASESGEVTLTGNNLDHALTLTLSASVTKPGRVAVSGARLAKAVEKMDSEELSISLKKSQLMCEGPRESLALMTLADEEFPPTSLLTGETSEVEVTASKLGSWLNRCYPFICTDETRFVLNGVYFNLSGSTAELKLVATDGRRLAVANRQLKEGKGCIVPRLAVKLMADLVTDQDPESSVLLRFDAHALQARGANWLLTTKLLEGNFPNYAQVIPPMDGMMRRVTVARKLLSSVLPFVRSVLNKDVHTVKLTVEGGKISLSGECPDVGRAAVVCDGKAEGKDFSVGYNGIFLTEVVGVMTGENVTMAMADELSPMCAEEEDFLVVLMPMRLS